MKTATTAPGQQIAWSTRGRGVLPEFDKLSVYERLSVNHNGAKQRMFVLSVYNQKGKDLVIESQIVQLSPPGEDDVKVMSELESFFRNITGSNAYLKLASISEIEEEPIALLGHYKSKGTRLSTRYQLTGQVV